MQYSMLQGLYEVSRECEIELPHAIASMVRKREAPVRSQAKSLSIDLSVAVLDVVVCLAVVIYYVGLGTLDPRYRPSKRNVNLRPAHAWR